MENGGKTRPARVAFAEKSVELDRYDRSLDAARDGFSSFPRPLPLQHWR